MKGATVRTLGLIALSLLLVAPMGSAHTEGGGIVKQRDRDCADFPSQAAAQNYFDQNGGSPSNNVDALDADGDGVVCESNPCPCANPGDGGGGGGGSGGGGDPGGGGTSKKRAEVISVTDGDTIKVRTSGAEKDVRLIGIDTPEVYGGVECGGQEASSAMKNLLHPGDRVSLIKDSTQDSIDRYGRLLRFVEHKGVDVGRKQVLHGRAHVYVYAGVPFARVGSYRRAQRSAKNGGRGNWGDCGGKFRDGGSR